MTPALPFSMVAPVPAQISNLPPRLSTPRHRPALARFPAFGRKPCSTNQTTSPSSAPRGVNISPVLSSFRTLPVITGVYPPSFPTTDSPAFRHANSFAFKSLQPLFAKHPGGGVTVAPASAATAEASLHCRPASPNSSPALRESSFEETIAQTRSYIGQAPAEGWR